MADVATTDFYGNQFDATGSYVGTNYDVSEAKQLSIAAGNAQRAAAENYARAVDSFGDNAPTPAQLAAIQAANLANAAATKQIIAVDNYINTNPSPTSTGRRMDTDAVTAVLQQVTHGEDTSTTPAAAVAKTAATATANADAAAKRTADAKAKADGVTPAKKSHKLILAAAIVAVVYMVS